MCEHLTIAMGYILKMHIDEAFDDEEDDFHKINSALMNFIASVFRADVNNMNFQHQLILIKHIYLLVEALRENADFIRPFAIKDFSFVFNTLGNFPLV